MELLPEDINAARQRIAPYVHKTPVFTSSKLSLIGGRCMYMKAENLQKTGSFKARGAANAVLKLLEDNKNIKGVVTHSSGNHGQALAFAAKMFGVSCTVVVPENAPKVKVDSILEYNAEIIFCKPTMKDRVETCENVIKSTGKVLVHPHDDLNVMAGQGTIACEFLEQVPQLDALVVPVGGGGMVSGIACWTKFVNPAVKVYCVEPVGKNLANSLKSGSQNCVDPSKLIPTIADGLRVPRLGKHCFSVVRSLSEKTVLSVNDADIIQAMKFTYERVKLVVETSAAAAVAAVLRDEGAELPDDVAHVGIILSGGNVDLDALPWMHS